MFEKTFLSAKVWFFFSSSSFRLLVAPRKTERIGEETKFQRNQETANRDDSNITIARRKTKQSSFEKRKSEVRNVHDGKKAGKEEERSRGFGG